MQALMKNPLFFLHRIKSIGCLPSMEDFEKRKLGIFNLLNVLGFLIGIFLPVVGLTVAGIELSFFAWMVTFSPAMVSMLVLVLNHYHKHESGILCYFIMYPILTALVYRVSFDIGVELFFILYGVLSVFFLTRLLYIAIAFSLTLFCYFYVFVFSSNYEAALVDTNFPFYVMNHILPAGFIFYALFLIKKENTQYQLSILRKNKELNRVNLELNNANLELNRVNLEIKKQSGVIDEKARLLQKQTNELRELNSMKNKLFSVISHDLKTPLYALRNLFRSVQQYDLPAEEIKVYIPEVVNNLNFTTSLMENLLQWVKSQMQKNEVHPQIIEMSALVSEATDLLRLQADTKQIAITFDEKHPVHIYADRDMISLVIRNLLSNAIKFTPASGSIEIGIIEKVSLVELYVKDTGVGIEPHVMKQLFENKYYSTQGTANETGTGLGLMLCNDFITKNGGNIQVKSEVGKGSVFSFVLPRKMVA
jgi:two-component system, sensor histidine kinase and response regulator